MHWQALCNFSLDCVHEKRGSGVTDMTKSIVQYYLSCYICVNDSTVYFSLIYECGYSFPWSEWVTSCMCVPFHAFTWRNYCSKSCDVKIKNNLTNRIIVQNPIPLPHVTLGEWVTQWYMSVLLTASVVMSLCLVPGSLLGESIIMVLVT